MDSIKEMRSEFPGVTGMYAVIVLLDTEKKKKIQKGKLTLFITTAIFSRCESSLRPKGLRCWLLYSCFSKYLEFFLNKTLSFLK